jgi:hypothetical protein
VIARVREAEPACVWAERKACVDMGCVGNRECICVDTGCLATMRGSDGSQIHIVLNSVLCTT